MRPPCAPRSWTSSSPARRSCCATPASTPTPSTPCWPRAWRSLPSSASAPARSRPPAPTTRETFDDLATAYARANNLREPELGEGVDDSLLTEVPSARSLLPWQLADAGRRRAALAADDLRWRPVGQLAALRAPHRRLLRRRAWSWTRTRRCATNRLRLLNSLRGRVRQRGGLRQDGQIEVEPVTGFNRCRKGRRGGQPRMPATRMRVHCKGRRPIRPAALFHTCKEPSQGGRHARRVHRPREHHAPAHHPRRQRFGRA